MKADLTILFAEDYKKYNISTRGCRDVLEALTPYFWSSVVEEVLQSYRDDLYMSSTRDIDDDNNVGIYVMPRCFSTLENTKKISVKPVIKNPSNLTYNFTTKEEELFRSEDDPNKDVRRRCFFKYGVYPSELVSKKNRKKLERAYKKNKLIKTGKEYTIDSKKYEEYTLPSEIDRIKLYNLFSTDVNGNYLYVKKYMRFTKKVQTKIFKREKEEVYWVNVNSIEWYINEKDNIAISRYNVFSGVPLTLDNHYYGNIEKTYLYEFLNNTFSTEILPLGEYFIEKSIEKIGMDDNNREMFYKIINNDIDILKKYSTETILYYIKEKYSGLKDEECEKIVVGLLKYISLTEDNYFYQEVEQEKELKNIEEEKENKENKISEYKKQMRLNNKTCEEITDDVSKYITSDMTNDEITEMIYSMYPGLKHEELGTILNELNNKPKVLTR